MIGGGGSGASGVMMTPKTRFFGRCLGEALITSKTKINPQRQLLNPERKTNTLNTLNPK